MRYSEPSDRQAGAGEVSSKEGPAMSSFRRLPPVMRMASLLRPLFPLGLFAASAFLVTAGQWSSSRMGVYAVLVAVIAANLSLLGLACSLVVGAYNVRFRQPDRKTFPLDSWQSQVRAILAMAALPCCALVLAVVIPPTARAFEIVFPASIIGVIVFLVVSLSNGYWPGSQGRAQTPPTAE